MILLKGLNKDNAWVVTYTDYEEPHDPTINIYKTWESAKRRYDDLYNSLIEDYEMESKIEPRNNGGGYASFDEGNYYIELKGIGVGK